MKAIVGAFNQEKALVGIGAFSVIVKLRVIFAKVRLNLYLSVLLVTAPIPPITGAPPHHHRHVHGRGAGPAESADPARCLTAVLQ